MIASLIPTPTPMVCGCCQRTIPAGENYVRFDKIIDGREVAYRWCVRCFQEGAKS